MSLSCAHLDAMLAANMTAEQIVTLVKADMAEREAQLESKRAKDAERQRRHRESRDVTVTACDKADPFLDKKPPHTPSKIKPIQVPPFIPPIMSAWNEMAGKHKLTKIQSVAGKRRKAVAARVDEHGLEGVLRAISAVPKSPHWLGENGWFGNFDSLMRPDHCQRMIELAEASGPALTAEEIRENRVKMAELYDRMGRQDEAEEIRRSLAA